MIVPEIVDKQADPYYNLSRAIGTHVVAMKDSSKFPYELRPIYPASPEQWVLQKDCRRSPVESYATLHMALLSMDIDRNPHGSFI